MTTTKTATAPASTAPASYREELAARTAAAQAEATKLIDTPEHRAVAEAAAKAEQAAATKAQAEKAAADMTAALEKMQREAAEATAKARQAAEQEERARRAIVDAERLVKPPVVTLEVAKAMAKSLLDAITASETTDANKSIPALWDTADDVRCRLLTDEIAPDAQRLVLATEGVLAAMDDFEQARLNDIKGLVSDETRRRLELIDIRGSFRPSESAKVARRVVELRIILDGEPAPKAPETIGTLIGQNLSLNQICKMLNLVRVDGGPDLIALGGIIDSALYRYGYYENVSQWQHLASTGAMSLDDAWQMRQHKLPSRRESEHGRPGSPARAGERRLGREVVLSYSEAFDQQGPHFRASLQRIADRRAAEANSKSVEDNPFDEPITDADLAKIERSRGHRFQ